MPKKSQRNGEVTDNQHKMQSYDQELQQNINAKIKTTPKYIWRNYNSVHQSTYTLQFLLISTRDNLLM